MTTRIDKMKIAIDYNQTFYRLSMGKFSLNVIRR